MKNWTPLMWFYLVCALAGAVVPLYYNLQFMLYSGETFTVARLLGDGMATPLSSSLTTDFLIGASAVVTWMMIEGRRQGMKHLWLYLLLTFGVAFAFACPFFLFMRERKLMTQKTI
jgi:hypothetical protein